MLLRNIIVASALFFLTSAQITRIKRQNPLLHRKKRYLAFPKNCNFVITMSAVKSVQQVQPRGVNTVLECDIPFPLPDDPRWFKKLKNFPHHVQRREILDQIETVLTEKGLNGVACVKRIVCEARQFIDSDGKSMVKDIFSAIFASMDIDIYDKYDDFCHLDVFSECSIPFVDLILGSFQTKEY